MQILEIGCAPGKLLSWVAAVLKANVSGLDYSKPGMEFAAQLFNKLNLKGDLHCEDVFAQSFPDEYFAVVYSLKKFHSTTNKGLNYLMVIALFVASCLLSVVSWYTTQQGMALYLAPPCRMPCPRSRQLCMSSVRRGNPQVSS